MDKKMQKQILTAVVVLVLVLGVGFWWWSSQQPSKYTAFAQCLKDEGATFYGAFWCPHCQSQKAMFGNAQKDLPYVECSTADSNGQLPVCNEAKVSAYPTWEFADGSRKEGELTLQELAEKTGCTLPQ